MDKCKLKARYPGGPNSGLHMRRKHQTKDFKYIPELMAACMRATYGISETKFRKSRKSLSLDSIAKNLSGETNPGSRILLAKMQSRKKKGPAAKESC
uniref:Uncharacterized protein n=1 Tax=Magallana gigas TaxID=29159 RepID=A0A8W8LRS6_MAGGI